MTPTTLPAPTTPRRYAARAAGALALVLAASGSLLGLTVAPAAASTHTVLIKQYAYTPASLTVDEGDTVTWTNQDTVQHDVMITAGPAMVHSPMLSKGQSWSHTFGAAGSYSYVCSVHPDMVASITVRAAAPRPTRTKAPALAPASPAPTTSVPAPTQAAAPTRTTKARAAQAGAQVAAPAPEQQLASTAATTTKSLDPLLLVAGASTAVTVFCLLLLTSRPARQPAPEPSVEEPTGT